MQENSRGLLKNIENLKENLGENRVREEMTEKTDCSKRKVASVEQELKAFFRLLFLLTGEKLETIKPDVQRKLERCVRETVQVKLNSSSARTTEACERRRISNVYRFPLFAL